MTSGTFLWSSLIFNGLPNCKWSLTSSKQVKIFRGCEAIYLDIREEGDRQIDTHTNVLTFRQIYRQSDKYLNRQKDRRTENLILNALL